MKYALVLSILSSLGGPGRSFLPTSPNNFFHSTELVNRGRLQDSTSKRCSSRLPPQELGEKDDPKSKQLPDGIASGRPKQARRQETTNNQPQRYPAARGRGNSNNNNNNNIVRRRTTTAEISPQQKVFDSILGKFRNSDEIDLWMNHTVMQQLEEQPPSGGDDLVFPNKSWSSRDDTEFIRCLRDRGAYEALELYACHLAQKNVFVYTAAISSMASCPDRQKRKRVLTILDQMDQTDILPSAVTFASLFRAANGPEEARNIMTRLQKYKGKTTWSVEAFNQAIIACSRKPSRQKQATQKSWQVAIEFSYKLRREGLSPNLKTYTALLHVCAQTGQLRIAMSLVREIEATPGISANARVYGVVMNVCAQAGDYVQANAVLKTMQKEGLDINLAHCSALLKALSKNGNVPVSLAVLDMMTGSKEEESDELPGDIARLQLVKLPSIAPDLVALNTILASCAKANDFEAARVLLDRMRGGEFCLPGASQPIYPDVISYSLLLSSCRDPTTARAIWKEMHLSRRYRVGVVRPNQIIFARLIAVCAKADEPDMESARFFLSSARKDGVQPTVFMYTAAIWTAERSSNYTFAKEILDEMKAEEGVEANGISYAGVMSAAAKAGLADEAFELFKESKKAGCSPTTATYNALAMAVRQSQIPDKLVKLESIFTAMDDADRRVDVGGAVIEQLIVEHGRVGCYTEAKRVFDMIEGPSNGPCLRAMLNACATADTGPRWKEAVALLHSSDITSSAIGPGEMDPGALSSAMIACAKADCWEESLNLLHLYGVKKRSSSVSVVALNAVIAACGRKGRPDIAVGLLNDMKRRYGVISDERSYRSAIIACNQAEHQKRRHETQPLLKSRKRADRTTRNDPAFEWWECALALLRRMKEDGLKPDIQTLSSAISACEAAGQWQRALSVLQSIIDENEEEDERFLNLFCFNAVISSCEKGGAWVEAVEIYERMISYGGPLQPNFITLSSLVLALENAGQKELALSKYHEGLKKKIVNPWRTTKDSKGRPLKAMDLHMFNSAMASASVRSFMDSLASRNNTPKVEADLVIIVGKGLRSTESPKLLPIVQELLSQEYGITAKLDPQNSGRLLVDVECLRTFVAGRNWS